MLVLNRSPILLSPVDMAAHSMDWNLEPQEELPRSISISASAHCPPIIHKHLNFSGRLLSLFTLCSTVSLVTGDRNPPGCLGTQPLDWQKPSPPKSFGASSKLLSNHQLQRI